MACQDTGFHCGCWKQFDTACCHCERKYLDGEVLRYALEPGAGGITAPAKPGDAGYDVASTDRHELFPGQVVMVSTGVSLELPCGVWGLIKVRSSIGTKGILLASSGVIDTRYRGVIKVPLVNVGQTVHTILAGARVGQLILLPLTTVPLKRVEAVGPSERGSGGFGSTGV